MKIYRVGGCVRDFFLGIQSKDIDYAVEANSFEEMKTELLARGMKIYPTKDIYMTLRGKLNGIDADFVLCRKDGFYSDGRRPDTVEMGTIYDDLARRDFCFNAIAIDEDTGEVLDPFEGRKDIANKLIRCVGSTDRLKEDSLRMLRALRFSITKDFRLKPDIVDCIENNWKLLENVSRERIAVELNLMFTHSTSDTFRLMIDFQDMFEFIFDKCKVDLKAVLKEIK
jgi:tRNA nucleotidyltransferase/poly(A) polymerase